MRRISERLQVALVALGVLTVAAFWAYLLAASPSAEPFTSPSKSSASDSALQRVTIVGAGCPASTRAGGKGSAGYPSLLAARYRWQVTTIANDGAGYVTRGQ